MKSILNCIFFACFLFASVPAFSTEIRYGTVPSFELTDQNGKTVKSDNLKGKVWIADFIFTRCQTQCPLMSRQVAVLAQKLPDPNIKFVSFSVDPEHDTPKVLSAYAKEYGAKKGKWYFLTGDKTIIWNLASDGFRLGVDSASPEDLKEGAQPILHSSRFVLVDREGNIRGFFDSAEPEKLNELIQAAQQL